MSELDGKFKSALAGKRIPPLTLDNKWHRLFTQTQPDKRLQRLEKEIGELLKQQSKANTEIKKIKRLKKSLMQEIMENATASSSGNEKAIKKAEDNKRLLEECNEKITAYEDELFEVPREIDKANKELMLLTMQICYDRLKTNEREIAELSEWIAQVREELKEKLIRKEEMEEANHELYSYMHDIFGAEVIDIFDMKYYENPSGKETRK